MPTKKQQMTVDERNWKAESDARTLAEAEVIKNDGARRRSAALAARRMMKEKEAEAAAMKKIAILSARKIKLTPKSGIIKKTTIRKAVRKKKS